MTFCIDFRLIHLDLKSCPLKVDYLKEVRTVEDIRLILRRFRYFFDFANIYYLFRYLV